MEETFDQVVHLAPTACATVLRDSGAERVVEFPDLLTHGPVSSDPKKHRKRRLEYWRTIYESALGGRDHDVFDRGMEHLESGYLSIEQLGSATKHLAGDDRIVVWTAPTWPDRLFLWFAFQALLEADVPVEQIATAESRIPLEGEEETFAGLASLEVDELISGFDDLFYPELIYVEAGAQLWENYISVSPRQFAISIPHTTKFFPDFPAIAEDWGRLFPNSLEHPDRIGLSRFDRALLAELEEDWRRPIDVLEAPFGADYAFLDDIFIVARLVAWSEYGEEAPVVEVQDGDAGDVLRRNAYRLTDAGRELKEEGYRPPGHPPIMHVGDCRVYSGKTPWVRVVEEESWWFERFEPSEG